MTAKAALCQALLDGFTLNVKNCLDIVGLTNCAREVSRMVEKPFGVKVTRTHRNGKSRYGHNIWWVDYRLKRTRENKRGILRMKLYITASTT